MGKAKEVCQPDHITYCPVQPLQQMPELTLLMQNFQTQPTANGQTAQPQEEPSPGQSVNMD